MNDIQIFNFQSKNVRVVKDDNGEPWFVAKDVCEVLGLTNPSEALKSLDSDEKSTLRNSEGRAGAGAQCFNIINESGLYALVIRSNKPNARKFRKWITSEVLPAIRKTGRYDIRREAEKQPESPLPATQRPSFVPEAHYYGVPVISLQKLAELVGTAPRNIHNDLQTGYMGELVNGVDLFRVKSRRELYAAGIPRDFHIGANNIDLFSRSGFEKIVKFRHTHPLMGRRPGHAAPPAVPAVPAVVKPEPEPVRPLDLKLASGRKTVESVTVSADKIHDLMASRKDPLYEILRKLSQAGYDVREAMAEFSYLSSCFFREEMLRMELWAILKTASNKVTGTLYSNLNMTYHFHDDRIVNQQHC